jgi:hypothetical protein
MFTKIKFLATGSLRIINALPCWMAAITYETPAFEVDGDTSEYFWTLEAAEDWANQRAKALLDEGSRDIEAGFVRARRFTRDEEGGMVLELS